MKCLILFSGKNKKNIINLSSAENALRVMKVKKIPKTLWPFSNYCKRHLKKKYVIIIATNQRVVAAKRHQRELVAL